MYEFKFADIGEGLHEGTVTEIHVKVGDAVKEGDPLFGVETDKVTSDIPSPTHGKISEIKIKSGQLVHVGEVVILIDQGGGSKTPAPTKSAPEAEQPAAGGGGASVVGEVKVSDEVLPVFGAKAHPAKAAPVKVQAAPLARKMALEKGLDLTTVKGTGPNGRIVVADVEKALAAKSATPTAPTPAPAAPASAPVPAAAPAVVAVAKQGPSGFVARREKTTGIRQAIAKTLKSSWDHVAYTNLVLQVDVTELWNLRSSIKDAVLKSTGVKLTFLPYILKATAIALAKFPIFTATYDEKTQELVYPATLNLGVAVDTENGLLVPNIKNAQNLTVLQLAQEVTRLASGARNRKLTGADSSNGHFTITNYGSAGALFGTPVIKFPEIAILGVGAIIDQAQTIAVGSVGGTKKVMYLTVAADHRWVDGATMGYFGQAIKELLENPALLSVY